MPNTARKNRPAIHLIKTNKSGAKESKVTTVCGKVAEPFYNMFKEADGNLIVAVFPRDPLQGPTCAVCKRHLNRRNIHLKHNNRLLDK